MDRCCACDCEITPWLRATSERDWLCGPCWQTFKPYVDKHRDHVIIHLLRRIKDLENRIDIND